MMNHSNRRDIILGCLIMKIFLNPWRLFFRALPAFLPSVLCAASGSWSGGSADANWSTSGNWQGGTIPGATSGTVNSDTANFTAMPAGTAGTSANPVVIDAWRNLGGINIDNAATSFVIGSVAGNPLRLSGGGQIRNHIAQTETIHAPLLFLGTSYTLNSSNGGGSPNLIFSGALSGGTAGATTLTLTGDAGSPLGTFNGAISNGAASSLGFAVNNATWIFNNPTNSFTGGIVLNGGTLSVGNAAALSTGALTLGGGTLQNITGAAITLSTNNEQTWNGDFAFNSTGSVSRADLNLGTGAVTLGGDRTVNVNNNMLSIGGVIAGNFGLTKSGGGTLALGGANTYSGATVVSAGTLAISAAVANSSAFTANGGTLMFAGANGAAASTSGFAINAGGTLKWDDTSSAKNSNRLGNALITLNGGAFNFSNDAANATFAGTVNALALGAGCTSALTTASAGAGGTATLTFTSLTRSAGATLNATMTNGGTARNKLLVGNAATVFGSATPTFIPWISLGGAPAAYDATNGLKAQTIFQTSTTESIWLTTDNLKLTAAKTLTNHRNVNSLTFAPASSATLNLGGFTLTPASGGLVTSGTATISNGSITFGASEGIVYASGTTTIAANLTGSGGLTKFGSGSLLLTGAANAWSGATSVGAGTLQIGTGGAVALLPGAFIGNGATLAFNTSTSGTLTGSVDGPGTLSQSGTAGVITLNQSAGAHSIGNVSGVNGATLIFSGDAASITTLGSTLDTAGFTAKFNGGTWILNAGGSYRSALEINAGTVQRPAGTGDFYNLTALTVHGGQLLCANNYGLRLGNTFGAGSGGAAFTGVQDGGLVIVTGNPIELGSNSAGITASYALTGGSLSASAGLNLNIGAATTGAGTTTFSLAGSGKLVIGGSIQGMQGAGAVQVFSFTGGMLAAGTFNATNLRPTSGGAGGILVQSGGTLAPGDAGTPGLMNVTGGWQMNAGTLAIDVGGTTPASGFQSGAASCDLLKVNGAVTLGGALSVTLTHRYVPQPGDVLNIVQSNGAGAAINGAFSNVAFGSRLVTADGQGSFVVAKSGTTVTLANFVWLASQPAISVQPASATYLAGKTVTLTVVASGKGPLMYQWRKNGVAISGATSPILTLGAITAGDVAVYDVVVTNSFGSATSTAASLGLNSTPFSSLRYEMDQTPNTSAGGILDATGNTAGTMFGTPLPTVIAGASGATGNAWDFSAQTSHISVAPNATTALLGDLNQSAGLTVAMWIKLAYQANAGLDNLSALQLGSTLGAGTGNGDGTFHVGFGSYNSLGGFASTKALDGAWHHVVATLDFQKVTGNAVLYLDGRQQVTQTISMPAGVPFHDTTNALKIGANGVDGSPWPGKMDQVCVLSKALTAAEVTQLYASATISNYAPLIVVGVDTSRVPWPANATGLHATVMDDLTVNPTTTWSMVSGSGTVAFGNAASANTTATFSALGAYVLRCTTSDGTNTNYAELSISVVANTAPIISAFADRTTLLNTTSLAVNLTGLARDDGLPNPPAGLVYQWSQVSGPTTVTFADPTALSTAATLPGTVGSYVLRLTVSDGALSSTADVPIQIVNNLAPVVSATAAQNALIVPANTTTLNVTASDDGNPATPGVLSYVWTQVSGPATATFAAANSASTGVTLPAAGQYVFRVTVSDGSLATTADTYVTAWSPGKPLVNPGSSRAVWLPDATLNLQGALSNASGAVTIQWSLAQGPAAVTFGTPSALTTTASFTTPGTYWLELAATDGSYQNTSRIVVEVYDSAAAPSPHQGDQGILLGGNFNFTASQLTSFTGDLGAQHDFSGINWARFTPPPPPGVHPRILFNPEDLPDLRARLGVNTTATTTEGPVLMNTIRTYVAGNLTNGGVIWRAVYDDLATGDVTSFRASTDQDAIVATLMYECFRCLLENDTTAGAKAGKALAMIANEAYAKMVANPGADWGSASANLHHEFIGYAYDYCYNFMTDSQRAALRQALAQGTTNKWSVGMDSPPVLNANSTNWVANNCMYLLMDALAIEGEPGYDANVLPRLQAAFERWYADGVFPDGALYEGMGKGALYAESLIPLAKRGIYIGANAAARYHVSKFYTQCMETTGYGWTWDEYLGGNNINSKYADIPVLKWFFPNDPLIDFAHRNELGANYLTSDKLTSINTGFVYASCIQMLRAVTVQDFNTSMTWNQAVTSQVTPNARLTQLFNMRGLIAMRSDWTANGMRLLFQPRSESGGHSVPDRNTFMLSALGRIWMPYYGGDTSASANNTASCVRIDDASVSIWPAAVVDVYPANFDSAASDSALFTYATGDAKNAYTYQVAKTTAGASLQSWTYNQMLWQPLSWPWANMLWSQLAQWYSGLAKSSTDSAIYWVAGNPVQRAFRTTAMVRGADPFAIVVDDIQKDSAPHSYNSRLLLATDLTSITTNENDAIVTAPGGTTSLLVRVVGCNGTPTFTNTHPGNLNALDITVNAVAPDFKVLLLPYTNGTALPTTTWSGNVLTVQFSGGPKHRIQFAPAADGRTRLAYVQPTDDTPPVLTLPSDISATATMAQGAVVDFSATATDNVDGAITPVCTPASGSVFPIGTTIVNAYAVDSSLNAAGGSFTITVLPGPFVLTAPTGLMATPGDQSATLAWNAVTPATTYHIKRSSSSSGPFTTVASGVTSTSYMDTGLTNGATYYYIVSAFNGAGEGSDSVSVSVVPARLPAGWSDADIGAVNLAGNASCSFASGTYTVTGAGADIWNNADAFHFVYVPWSGDGTLVARVSDLTGTDGWAKAGVMFRNSLAPEAMNSYAALSYSNGATFQNRSVTAGSSTNNILTPATAPFWVKLTRAANTFKGYASPDGITWTQIGAESSWTPSGASIYAGLALTSHNTSALNTAHFDNAVFLATPTIAAGNGSASLDWSGSAGADSYNIKRSLTSGSAYSLVANVSGSSYTDPTLSNYTSYYYVIEGVGSHGVAVAAPEISVTPGPAVTPTGVTLTPGVGQITVNWSPALAAAGYAVKRAISSSGPFVTLASGLTTTSYTDVGLHSGVIYYYQVTASNPLGESIPSAAVGAASGPGVFTKANNATALDQATSWTPAGISGSLDTVVWTGSYGMGSASIGIGLSTALLQVTSPSQAMTVDSGSGSLILAGLSGTAIDMSAASQNFTINCPVSLAASQSWNVGSARTLFVNGAISGGGGNYLLTKTGAGVLALGGSYNADGGITLLSGTLAFKQGGAVTIAGPIQSSTGTTLSTSSAGTALTINQPAGAWTLASISGVPGTSTVFSGTGMTTIGSNSTNVGSPGMLLDVAGGTVKLSSGRNILSNIQVDAGGILTVGNATENAGNNSRFSFSSGQQTFVMNGGQVIINNTSYGVRLGGDGGAGGSGSSFSGTQTGGAFVVSGTGNNMTLGSTTGSLATSYSLSGGSLTIAGGGGSLTLGADTGGTSTTSFTISGTGKLVVAGTIAGNQAVGARQNLIFSGGTLAAGMIDMTKLTASGAVTGSTGTCVSSGGTLAPGDVGMAGKSAIVGNYSLGVAGTLAVDVGGTTQGTAFQTGQYDYLTVSGSTNLEGNLAIRLINGFAPNSSTAFTVLNSTGTLTGAFANVAPGQLLVTSGGEGTFVVTMANNKVTLGSYSALTALQSWRYANFGTIANSGNAADTADPDGDGLNNLLEYAFGGNPNTADNVVPTLSINAGGNVQITFARLRSELSYLVQSSNDLVTWATLANNPGTYGQTVTFTGIVAEGKSFLRLRVTSP